MKAIHRCLKIRLSHVVLHLPLLESKHPRTLHRGVHCSSTILQFCFRLREWVEGRKVKFSKVEKVGEFILWT